MLGIPNALGRPIGGATALLDALRVLPEIAENTAAMAKATRTLPKIERRLADIEAGVAGIDGRMANIEAAMPVLVEVQGSLRNLPDNMARLDQLIDQLLLTLAELGTGIDRLHLAVEPLQETAAGVGRLVRRLPGSNRQ